MRSSTRPVLRYAALPAVLLTVSLGLTACGGDDDTAGDAGSATSPDASSSTGGSCDYPTDGTSSEATPPPAEPTVSGEESATIELTQGTVEATLDAASAPCTVGSFVSLAEQGYFDDTVCHRLTTADSGIAVLQCGDPTGTGTGGPGYTIPDELSGDETYPAGTLAMANTGQPDTGGSQFFIVYGDTPLPPQYTVFGTIDAAGLKVVEEIGAAGTADGGPDGAPKSEVTIEKVTVG